MTIPLYLSSSRNRPWIQIIQYWLMVKLQREHIYRYIFNTISVRANLPKCQHEKYISAIILRCSCDLSRDSIHCHPYFNITNGIIYWESDQMQYLRYKKKFKKLKLKSKKCKKICERKWVNCIRCNTLDIAPDLNP